MSDIGIFYPHFNDIISDFWTSWFRSHMVYEGRVLLLTIKYLWLGLDV